ncbi:MAG: twin-arginine translocation pathway signal, partial [Pseudomonadota bacterium]
MAASRSQSTLQSRRAFLARTLALGCSAAASPLITPVTFASAPGDNRLVVIVLRGAMDALHAVAPVGDPLLRRYRPSLSRAEFIDLDGYFGLAPELGDLMALWRGGDLAFAQAVSTPYRDKRSHFDGQDLL